MVTSLLVDCRGKRALRRHWCISSRWKKIIAQKIAGFDEFGTQWTGVAIAATFDVQMIFEKEFQNRCELKGMVSRMLRLCKMRRRKNKQMRRRLLSSKNRMGLMNPEVEWLWKQDHSADHSMTSTMEKIAVLGGAGGAAATARKQQIRSKL